MDPERHGIEAWRSHHFVKGLEFNIQYLILRFCTFRDLVFVIIHNLIIFNQYLCPKKNISIGITFIILAVVTVLVIGNSRVEASGNKNTTFVKTYRFYDFNHARGIWPTKEGDYIFTGDVTVGLQSDAFISKLNKQGNPIWTKLIGSRVHYSGPMGKGPVDDAGYLAVQLKDGSYLLVGQTRGYVGDAEAKIFETPVDIFLSKFSQDGKHLWTQTVGDLADDTPSGLWPTNNGGFLLFGTLEELGAGADIGGDTDHYFFLAKFNAEGKKEWIKKTNFNIGGTMGEQEQVNFSTEQEDEDGFALVGTIPADEVLKQDDEEIGSHMPTVVKLDKNNNVV